MSVSLSVLYPFFGHLFRYKCGMISKLFALPVCGVAVWVWVCGTPAMTLAQSPQPAQPALPQRTLPNAARTTPTVNPLDTVPLMAPATPALAGANANAIEGTMDDPKVRLLLAEIVAQQKTIAENQVKMDEKMALIQEDIRLARAFASRGGGKTR